VQWLTNNNVIIIIIIYTVTESTTVTTTTTTGSVGTLFGKNSGAYTDEQIERPNDCVQFNFCN